MYGLHQSFAVEQEARRRQAFARTVEILGSDDAAADWLCDRAPRLFGGRRWDCRIDQAMDSNEGLQAVLQELDELEADVLELYGSCGRPLMPPAAAIAEPPVAALNAYGRPRRQEPKGEVASRGPAPAFNVATTTPTPSPTKRLGLRPLPPARWPYFPRPDWSPRCAPWRRW